MANKPGGSPPAPRAGSVTFAALILAAAMAFAVGFAAAVVHSTIILHTPETPTTIDRPAR